MKRIALAAATAAAVFTTAPSSVGVVPAQAENLQLAQVDVQIGRDREDRVYRDRRDSGVTVGVGPRGVEIGPRARCRTVTTTVDRDDGRRVSRTERRCD